MMVTDEMQRILTIKDAIIILENIDEGMNYQVKYNKTRIGNDWVDVDDWSTGKILTHMAQDYIWRVKPEPREFYMGLSSGGTITWTNHCLANMRAHEIIKVREVLEDE